MIPWSEMAQHQQLLTVYLAGMVLWALGVTAYFGYSGDPFDEGCFVAIVFWPIPTLFWLIVLPFLVAFKIGEWFRK